MIQRINYNIVNDISQKFNLNHCDIQFKEVTRKYITVSPIDAYVVIGYFLELEPVTIIPFKYNKKFLILQEKYMGNPKYNQ